MRLILPLLLVFFACSAAASPSFDAYDPKALVARASQLAAAGDFRAARILLARAQRIAPGDARVVRARQAIEARAAGNAVPDEAATPPAAVPEASPAPPASGPIPDPPPPVWRSK